MAEQQKQTDQIIVELKRAYEMEIETVINYLANSVHLDGLLAQEIREIFKQDLQEELGHATSLAQRLKVLNAAIPGSLALKFDQNGVQPPEDTTDVLTIIKGVIEAEEQAVQQYRKIIKLCEENDDYVTQDLATKLMGEEQEHKRDFVGFLKDLEARPTLK